MTPAELPVPPSINTVTASDRLEVTALVDVSDVKSTLGSGDLQIALAAVIEDDEGQAFVLGAAPSPRQARFPPR